MLVDALSIFDDNHVVADVTKSQRYIDLKADGEYGTGRDAYVAVMFRGTRTTHIRCQILGYTESDTTFTDPIVIDDSGLILSTDLNASGKNPTVFMKIRNVNKEYRYIGLRYIPSTGDADNGYSDIAAGTNSADATVDTANFAPPTKVDPLGTETISNNAISAYLTTIAPNMQAGVNIFYPHKNSNAISLNMSAGTSG